MSAKRMNAKSKASGRKQKKLVATPPTDFISRVKVYCERQKENLGPDYRYDLIPCRDAGTVRVVDNKQYHELYFDTEVFRLKNPKFQAEVTNQSALRPDKLGVINLQFWAPAPNPNQVVDECLVMLDGKPPSETVYSRKLLGI